MAVNTPRQSVPTEPKTKPRLPPRWFIRLFWFTHRRLYRLTRGRVGLWRPKANRWGAMRLTVVGRRTGLERSVMVGYFEDGPNLVTMAMNGWGEGEPAWWLNLQAHPEARVDLADGPRLVTGRAALGEEREQLWSRWRDIDKDLDAYAARRSTETAVVILQPRP
jgi:deazaflavin-dependent oxidoreductase (nitroreductase family)